MGPADGWRRLDQAGLPCARAIELLDFATHTTPAGLRSGAPRAVRWDSALPDLDRFDLVVSDNLPEVLSRRPDASLIAQFFWHDVLDDVDVSYRERALDLLGQYRPRIFGSSMFAMPEVSAQPGFQGVGLFANPASVVPASAPARDGLLLTGGSTPAARAALEIAVGGVAPNAADYFAITWIDPQLLPNRSFPQARPATFDEEMYASLGLAVCRPGLGVVTELITHRVPMIVMYEDDNWEMAHNARVLVDAGLAVDPARDHVDLSTRLDVEQWWRPPIEWPRLNGADEVADILLG